MAYNDYMTSLDGQTVVAIDVSENEQELRFRCADGSTIVWDTEADCYSETWWADALNLNELRDATVRNVESLELPDGALTDPNRTRQDMDEIYGLKIITSKGAAVLAFRNSSNGYYGGNALLGKDGDQAWTEITGTEWSA